MLRITKILCLCISVMLLLTACANNRTVNNISDSDSAVSSEIAEKTTPEEAVVVFIGQARLEDFFLLRSEWYGESYENPSSLNRLMMEKYALNEEAVLVVPNRESVNIEFKEAPEKIIVTRYGNTISANSGIPYDITDVEIGEIIDNKCSFIVNYNKFKMLYYTIECSWSNGNSAEYCFAVRK